jgi:hypothetical protein
MLCHYAERHILFTIMLNGIMLSFVILNVIMLSFVILNVVMLSVVAPNILLNVNMKPLGRGSLC